MSITIKEIIVKTTIEKQHKEVVSDKLIRHLKNSIIKELKQEKALYQTTKKER